MNKASFVVAALATLTLALPAMADGDAAKGEKTFAKCKSCHAIVKPDGTEVVKGGKTGPNLWGVIGRPVASEPDFKYGDGIKEVAAMGKVWDEESLAAYVVDPTKWLDEISGDAGAKSKMTFKLPKGGEDVAAYLATMK